MSNNIVAFSNANLPSVQSLSLALSKLDPDVGPTGIVILKMDKTGHWVFGVDQTEIEEGSKWAVNPFSFVHGYIAWGDGELLAEKMVPIFEPLPELEVAPPGAKKGWETQIGMGLKCMNGEDKGMEARFTTTSVGGKRSVQTLAVAIKDQVALDQTKPVPVIELSTEHYQHKSYGRIYTPVFAVKSWTVMNDKPAEVEVTLAPVAEAPAPAPLTRRRRVNTGAVA